MPSSRFCGKYAQMSDTSARASRLAFAFGSFARNGLIGSRATGAPDADGVGAAAEEPGSAGAAATGVAGTGGANGAAGAVRAGGADGVATGAGAPTGGAAPTANGRGANGALGVATPGRGPGPMDDGRAKGVGIPPALLVGRAGTPGIAGGAMGPPTGRGVAGAGAACAAVGRTGVDGRGALTGTAAGSGASTGADTDVAAIAGVDNAGVGVATVAAVAGVGWAGGADGGVAGAAGAGTIGVGRGGTGEAATLGVGTAGGAADGIGGVTRALTVGVAKSARASVPAAITITPPHTEHRARTLAAGILAGSTRKTERHSEHVTFMEHHLPERPSWVRKCASHPPAGCRCGGRPNRPTRPASWRNSSFRLRVH